MTGDHTFWYLSRAGGLVAFLLLFTTVVLGLTLTGGAVERLLRRYRIYDLHRFVAILALAMIAFHVLIVIPDSYVGFSLPQLLLPFASPYRPLFSALGVLGLYLTAIVVGSFYLRRLVPYATWRLVHYATFVAFALALAHGVGAGTDTAAGWARWLYVGSGIVVLDLAVLRFVFGHAHPGPRLFPEGPVQHPASRPVTERAGN